MLGYIYSLFYMNKKIIVLLVIVLLLIGGGAFLVNKYGSGVKPVLRDVPEDIGTIIDEHNALPPGENDTDFPLTVPDGFSIDVIARLPNARAIAVDTYGNLWVTQTKDNAVSLIVMKDGVPQEPVRVFKEYTFKNPHGIVFDPKDAAMLYIAEEEKIVRFAVNTDKPSFSVVAELPKGGRHTTRSLVFGSDGELYVSIGSTCDVCVEKDSRIGTIMRVNREKKMLEPYAKGLRNSVFMAVHPGNGTLWATEMGRDGLGDGLPPDEINMIEEGKNYGWPNCYGKNVHDTEFDKNTYIRNPCMEPFETESSFDLGAHVAPLGITFIPEEGWPEAYRYSAIVAYHGSWNSTNPIGYKLAQLTFDGKGNILSAKDFISGWLTKDNRALGRPVDVLALPGGTMYVTDDKAGLVYQLQYTPE